MDPAIGEEDIPNFGIDNASTKVWLVQGLFGYDDQVIECLPSIHLGQTAQVLGREV